MRLLVVEDNVELCGFLTEGLAEDGFSADVTGTAAAATAALTSTQFAAVILDLGLPDADGLSLLRAMRERNDPTPVLVLTARGAVQDRVRALRHGADDYLVKPFAFEELLVRIRALLRRPRDLLGLSLTLGNVVLYPEARQVFIENQARFFPFREVAVLEVLMRSSGQVVPREEVENHVFGDRPNGGSNAVDVYVHRLRKQLAEAKASAQIHTIRGVGYILIER
ncbi:MAG: response regulator transcription factor [Stellaceae bacterium]